MNKFGKPIRGYGRVHKLAIKFLDRIWAPTNEHWCRVVMNNDTLRIIQSIQPEKLKCLEISGTRWKEYSFFQEYTSVSYPEYDICNTSLPETYDLIIAEQVFEHLLWPYRAGQNVNQMLNANGYFLVSTPFMIRIHPFPNDCTRWTETGLKYFLAECGFPLEKIYTASWGNRECIKANFQGWPFYRPRLHSLDNESDYPLVVWALAQK